jgi:hypothetical protein
LILSDEILEVEISSLVTLRYPTASEDTLIISPVNVEKNPLLIFRVDAESVETSSSFTVKEDIVIEEPISDDPTNVE